MKTIMTPGEDPRNGQEGEPAPSDGGVVPQQRLVRQPEAPHRGGGSPKLADRPGLRHRGHLRRGDGGLPDSAPQWRARLLVVVHTMNTGRGW